MSVSNTPLEAALENLRVTNREMDAAKARFEQLRILTEDARVVLHDTQSKHADAQYKLYEEAVKEPKSYTSVFGPGGFVNYTEEGPIDERNG